MGIPMTALTVLSSVLISAALMLPGLISTCNAQTPSTIPGFIGVTSDGSGFVDIGTGNAFVPLGANYYDPLTGWAPKLWEQFDAARVDAHFRQMLELGLNTARVFTTAASFQPAIDIIDLSALEKLDKLIAIAKKYDIRLIITGPDHWEGSPSYWQPDKYAGKDALAALQHFWSVVVRRYADESTVMAWDLLNEPMIPWQSPIMDQLWKDWLRSKYGDSLPYPAAEEIPENAGKQGDAKLYDYQLFRESIARTWTKTQVDAIRTSGAKQMVTIGFIQWSFPLKPATASPSGYGAFDPRKLSDLLDFTCLHFYPDGDPSGSGKQRNIDYLRAAASYFKVPGKPMVMEEFGWYGGGDGKTEADQDDWNSAVLSATAGIASGWIPWPLYDSPSSTDISKYGGLFTVDGRLKRWGQSFKLWVQQSVANPPKLDTSLKACSIDYMALLTSPYPAMYLDDYRVSSGLIADVLPVKKPSHMVGSQLLNNGGFEEGGKTTPKGWAPSASNGKATYEKDLGRDSKACVSITVPSSNSAGWPMWRQTIKLKEGITWLLLETQVKVDDVVGGYGAYLALEFLDKKGSRISVAQSEGLTGTGEWKVLRASSEVPTGAASVSSNLILNGRGKAYFDGASLTVLK